MRHVLILLILLASAGCQTGPHPVTPGTQMWYDLRMTELNQARAQNKLTEQQYLDAKNGIDAIRVLYDRTYPRDPWTPPSWYYHHHLHH
jgi:hypothetical protein